MGLSWGAAPPRATKTAQAEEIKPKPNERASPPLEEIMAYVCQCEGCTNFARICSTMVGPLLTGI